jgi:ABC-2 type transport system permease protein
VSRASTLLQRLLHVLAPADVFLGELFRQPWLLFIVILGPFLILLAYGLGARITRDFPRTIVVQPAAASGLTPLQLDPTELSAHLQVVDVTSDRTAALARLGRGEAELMLELPADPQAALARGEQARIRLATNEINPVANAFTTLYVESQIAALNRQVIARTAAQAQAAARSTQGDVERLSRALDGFDGASVADQRQRLAETAQLLTRADATLAQLEDAARAASNLFGGATATALAELRAQRERVTRLQADVRALEVQLGQLPSEAEMARLRQNVRVLQTNLTALLAAPPEVLAAPFGGSVENVAPYQPTGATYFVPGILALALQHLALTLAAVSMARDRRLGILDLYRLSPAAPAEILSGKYLGLGLLVGAVAAAVVALVLGALAMPLLAGLGWLAATLLAFIFAALGLGFLIGLVTRNEDAAIQVAMLVLIASVAFGGLLAPPENLALPLRLLAQILPVTQGTILLQAAFFRGYLLDPLAPTLLVGLLVVAVLLSYRLFARELARR